MNILMGLKVAVVSLLVALSGGQQPAPPTGITSAAEVLSDLKPEIEGQSSTIMDSLETAKIRRQAAQKAIERHGATDSSPSSFWSFSWFSSSEPSNQRRAREVARNQAEENRASAEQDIRDLEKQQSLLARLNETVTQSIKRFAQQFRCQMRSNSTTPVFRPTLCGATLTDPQADIEVLTDTATALHEATQTYLDEANPNSTDRMNETVTLFNNIVDETLQQLRESQREWHQADKAARQAHKHRTAEKHREKLIKQYIKILKNLDGYKGRSSEELRIEAIRRVNAELEKKFFHGNPEPLLAELTDIQEKVESNTTSKEELISQLEQLLGMAQKLGDTDSSVKKSAFEYPKLGIPKLKKKPGKVIIAGSFGAAFVSYFTKRRKTAIAFGLIAVAAFIMMQYGTATAF